MPRTLKLFHARPNYGLDFERRAIHSVISRINELYKWEVVRYENYVSGAPSTPVPSGNVQENIDPVLLKSDIVVFTMGHQYGEGWTEREYDVAVAQWRDVGTPRILCYFAEFDGAPDPKWLQFFEKCKRDGCQGNRYRNDDRFEQKLINDLEWVLRGGAPSKRPAPWPPVHNRLQHGLLQRRIYVLSASNRTKCLVEQSGLRIEDTLFLIPTEPHVPPTAPIDLSAAEAKAKNNALATIRAALPQVQESIHANEFDLAEVIVVAADTLVLAGSQAQSTPVPFLSPLLAGMSDKEREKYGFDARNMVNEQNKCTSFHVVTGLAFCRADRPMNVTYEVATAEVWPQALATDPEINEYLTDESVLISPGAVTIDKRGVAFISKIDGQFSTVAGFPLAEFADHLGKQFGAILAPRDFQEAVEPTRKPLSVLSIGDINYDLLYEGLRAGKLRALSAPGIKLNGEIGRRIGGTAVQFARQCRDAGFEALTVGGIFGVDPPGEFIQRELETPPWPNGPVIEAIPGRQPRRKTSIAIIIREQAAPGEPDASLTITDAEQHLPGRFAYMYASNIETADVVFVSGYALADEERRQRSAIEALKHGFHVKALTVVDLTVDFEKSWRWQHGTASSTHFQSFINALDDGRAGSESTVVDVLVAETSELIRWFAKDEKASEDAADRLAEEKSSDWEYIRQFVIPKLQGRFRVAILRTPKYTEQLIVRLSGDASSNESGQVERLDYQELPAEKRTGYGDRKTASFVFETVAPRVLLASGSRQRLRLLEQIIDPRQLLNCSSETTEDSIEREAVEERVRRLAKAKALAVLEELRSQPEEIVRRIVWGDNSSAPINRQLVDNIEIIIAADTEAAWMDGTRIRQPNQQTTEKDLFDGLKELRANPHQMITGVSIMGRRADDGQWLDHLSTVSTRVEWRVDIPDADLWAYAHTRDGVDKAGGYAIQGYAGCFVKRISGSYSNVVGLPLEHICNVLKVEFGMPIWSLDRKCGWRRSNPIRPKN